MPKKRPAIFDEIASLPTESINPRTAALDRSPTKSVLRMINREDLLVAPAVGRKLGAVARAVDLAVGAIESGGRVFYVGAGTSGRLGVIDAAECPPTSARRRISSRVSWPAARMPSSGRRKVRKTG